MLVLGLVLRALLPAGTPDTQPVQLAIFGWLSVVAAAIITGLKAAGEATLFFLYQAVKGLWATGGLLHDGLVEVGRGFMKLGKNAWSFFRALYDHVLKPGWTKFWGWIDRAKTWLETFFKPVFEFLRNLREEILKFYDHWVRPIIDTIEAVRRILSVFKALGFEWASKLDQELARIEDKINEPFLFALRKINEVINVIDRIVTADGLFQRLALIKSIERDLAFINQSWNRAGLRDISPEDVASRRAKKYGGVDPALPGLELRKLYTNGAGQYAPIVGELVPLWRISAGLDTSPPQP